MSHSTVRLGNGSSMRFTELHCVNLSPENRFEASSLRWNSTATGTFRRHLGVLVRSGHNHVHGIVGVVLVGMVRVVHRSPNRLSPGTNDVRCVSFRRRQLTVISLRHVAIKIHTR